MLLKNKIKGLTKTTPCVNIESTKGKKVQEGGTNNEKQFSSKQRNEFRRTEKKN